MKKYLTMVFTFMCCTTAFAQYAHETAANRYFQTIQNDPQQLLVFLGEMPKGGDLHNHLGGASMAENMMRYAQNDHWCIDPKNYAVSKTECSQENRLVNAPQNSTLYNSIIDAWSMRNFYPTKESGHDHFFATFGKYSPIGSAHSGEMLSEVADRAGQQNEQYLELMVTPDNDASGVLGGKLGWDSNFTNLRQKLLANGLNDIVNDISKNMDNDEATLHKTLMCGTPDAKPGCDVKIKYLYQVLREQPPAQVFGQLVAGFEVASKDPRFVGINMVQPEDGFISMRDYKLHMQMVGFLHQLYPKVHISLHAGELNSTLVPTEGLRFHMRDAVEVAHADRIGHGVSVAYESRAKQLLKEMADKGIMVEINLTSNDKILGIKGKNHPLPLYMQFHVPVALSTDDEGVLRTDLTEQYQRAVTTYHFSYPTIKMLVRNSIAYSFLPGNSLWQDRIYRERTPDCRNDSIGEKTVSMQCQAFLNANEKAQAQWELEKRFIAFEKDFS